MSRRVDATFFTMRALAAPLFALAFRLTSEGDDHLPRRGAAILASNHASFLDPIVIGLRVRRPVRFMVSREFYANRKLQPVLKCFGTIPVGGKEGMVRSFRACTEIVRGGGLLGVFPEGGITRDGTMRPFRSGASVIALKTGVPVVPIHVGGTFEALPRTARWPRFVPVIVRIGSPIAVAASADPSADDIAALTESIRSSIAALGDQTGRVAPTT
jgi:1-acyl-sn-glycerol-3-phosphate acyltransferase